MLSVRCERGSITFVRVYHNIFNHYSAVLVQLLSYWVNTSVTN